MLKKEYPLAAQIGSAIRAFRSEACPACGGQKTRKPDPFCEMCLSRLPPGFREGFSDRSRFVELFHPAMAHLRKH